MALQKFPKKFTEKITTVGRTKNLQLNRHYLMSLKYLPLKNHSPSGFSIALAAATFLD